MSHNKLYELSGENLSICLRDRLHGLPSFGPPFSELGGEAAYDWLVAEYAAYREVSFRRVIFEILREFLQELPSPSLWPPTARDNLFVFIQLSKPDVSDCIWRLVASQAIFEEGSGPKKYRKECQAGLLKCCIALERLGLPAFWSQQLQVLGPGYGSIIFSGLAHHDLALAVRNLPQLCRTVESRSWILLTVPWLVDRFGFLPVADALRSPELQLPRSFQNELDTLIRELGLDFSAEPTAEVAQILESPEFNDLEASAIWEASFPDLELFWVVLPRFLGAVKSFFDAMVTNFCRSGPVAVKYVYFIRDDSDLLRLSNLAKGLSDAVGHDISNQVRYVVLTGIQQNKLLHFSNYWIANPLQHNAEGYQVMFGNSVVKGSMRLSDLETQGVVDRLSYIIQSPRIIHEPVTGGSA